MTFKVVILCSCSTGLPLQVIQHESYCKRSKNNLEFQFIRLKVAQEEK